MQKVRITDDCGWQYELMIEDGILPELMPHVRKVERLEDKADEAKRPSVTV